MSVGRVDEKGIETPLVPSMSAAGLVSLIKGDVPLDRLADLPVDGPPETALSGEAFGHRRRKQLR